jgi:hypothetical protein
MGSPHRQRATPSCRAKFGIAFAQVATANAPNAMNAPGRRLGRCGSGDARRGDPQMPAACCRSLECLPPRVSPIRAARLRPIAVLEVIRRTDRRGAQLEGPAWRHPDPGSPRQAPIGCLVRRWSSEAIGPQLSLCGAADDNPLAERARVFITLSFPNAACAASLWM